MHWHLAFIVVDGRIRVVGEEKFPSALENSLAALIIILT